MVPYKSDFTKNNYDLFIKGAAVLLSRDYTIRLGPYYHRYPRTGTSEIVRHSLDKISKILMGHKIFLY